MRDARVVTTVGAFALVAAAGTLITVLVVQRTQGERETVAVAATAAPADVRRIETPPAGTVSRVVAGVRFSIRLLPCCWERGPVRRLPSAGGFRDGRLAITKSTQGPQGAEAVIFWTSFPESRYADRCANLQGLPRRAGAAELAAAVASAPGTELVEGPVDVTVGGFAAKHVALRIRADVGCDPGFFYTWRPRGPRGECWGACWLESNAGDTVWVWIVGVRGRRLFIEAQTREDAGPDLEREIRRIVSSIGFHP